MGFPEKSVYILTLIHFCKAKSPIVTSMVWLTSSANTIINMDHKANVSTDLYTSDRPRAFTIEPVRCSKDWRQTGVKSSCGVRTCSELDSFLASD